MTSYGSPSRQTVKPWAYVAGSSGRCAGRRCRRLLRSQAKRYWVNVRHSIARLTQRSRLAALNGGRRSPRYRPTSCGVKPPVW